MPLLWGGVDGVVRRASGGEAGQEFTPPTMAGGKRMKRPEGPTLEAIIRRQEAQEETAFQAAMQAGVPQRESEAII
ncbi:hypothetical protein Pan97_19610 [Bremerella volcania]|uniref:Uncharacterized protein n=1 Tax=Bremerella volcania TaxID=2527984 RepID=A0A518C6U7_9BACT|nr:hypothetical protein [Bremerella volcania]QDU74941.1 hypothetical protein Pan97_19610 [Bremerella volcania]